MWEPNGAWTCPATHAIKGNFTTYSGERCIYHVPGGQFYGRAKPERCYATEDQARSGREFGHTDKTPSSV